MVEFQNTSERKVCRVAVSDSPHKELVLTVEEAYALLAMCLASPLEFDPFSLAAVDKLTAYCIELDREENAAS